MELDILTSRPKSPSSFNESQKKEEERLERDVIKGIGVEQKLASEEGKFFVEMIIKNLEKRIDELVKIDPPCQALLGVLEGFGNEIVTGKASSRRLAEMRLRRG